LIEAAAALEHLTGELVVQSLGLVYRYNRRVFLFGGEFWYTPGQMTQSRPRPIMAKNRSSQYAEVQRPYNA
jgi:predicted ATPase